MHMSLFFLVLCLCMCIFLSFLLPSDKSLDSDYNFSKPFVLHSTYVRPQRVLNIHSRCPKLQKGLPCKLCSPKSLYSDYTFFQLFVSHSTYGRPQTILKVDRTCLKPQKGFPNKPSSPKSLNPHCRPLLCSILSFFNPLSMKSPPAALNRLHRLQQLTVPHALISASHHSLNLH